jgi:predicted DNA-binding transcriptional regulator AlpA
MRTATKTKRPTLRRRPVKPAPAPPPTPSKPRFVFKHEVLERLGGISSVSLWRYCRDGKFPAAVSVGGKAAWLESDLDAWMKSRPPTKQCGR